MKKNYAGIASLSAFACAIPTPFILTSIFRSSVNTFAQQQGPGMLWITVFWIGGLTTAGVVLGIVGVYLSRRGFGGRTSSISGFLLNVVFLILQVRHLGIW